MKTKILTTIKTFVLAIVILTSTVVPNNFISNGVVAEAATKIKLNYTKKTLYVGDSFKLKITGTSKRVKWSSSNKKVATVTSKGFVKGISKGSCKITATISGKKYTCKVTVNAIKEEPKVSYINNRSVEYARDENSQRLFFGFLDENENVVSGNGEVNIRIENDGQIVYDDTVAFTNNDFGTWTWYNGAVSKYVCCIRIPISEIAAGKNSQGTIYFTVNEWNASFDEYSLNIYNLPQKTATFNLPKLPKTVLQNVLIKDISGRYREALCNINIDNIETKTENSHVKFTITGSVTPTIDTITWVGSDSYYFTVKLLRNGIVVDSRMAMTPSIYLNNKFSCDVSFYDIDNSEEYTIEICSYN